MITSSQKLPIKLTEPQKVAIVKMIGQMMSNAEIVLAMKENYSIDISSAAVSRYRKDRFKWNAIKITERDKFISNIQTVPMYHQKVRVQRIENLYNNALSRNKPAEMAEALRLATAELKKSDGATTYTMFNQFNMNMSKDEIKSRIEKLRAKRSGILTKLSVIDTKEAVEPHWNEKQIPGDANEE